MADVACLPPRSGRIAEIEVLRAIAILMVLYEHVPFNLIYWHSLWLEINWNVWRGGSGVELFFTISGFVIARSLLPQLASCASAASFWASVLTFWLRRFWRLQPAAWFWIAAPIALGAVFNRSGAFHSVHANVAAGLTGMLAITNLRVSALMALLKHGIHVDTGMNFPSWSLSLEEQFYVLLPLLALVFRRNLGWATFALVIHQFVMPPAKVLTWTRPGPIAVGVLLAMGSTEAFYPLWEPSFLARRRLWRAGFLAVMLGLLGMVLSTMPQPTLRITFGVSALLCGGLVYAASFDRGYIMGPGRVRNVLLWIGARSYALYLTHIPAYAIARETVYRLRPPTFEHPISEAMMLLSVGVPLAFIFADLSYRFIEVPCRRYGRTLRVEVPVSQSSACLG